MVQKEDHLPKSTSVIIHTIRDDPAFERCLMMYNKVYAQTAYLKFSVPVIMKFVQKENLKGLKRFFAIEKIIRSGR